MFMEIIPQYNVSWVVRTDGNGKPVTLKVNREDLNAVVGSIIQSGIKWCEIELIEIHHT